MEPVALSACVSEKVSRVTASKTAACRKTLGVRKLFLLAQVSELCVASVAAGVWRIMRGSGEVSPRVLTFGLSHITTAAQLLLVGLGRYGMRYDCDCDCYDMISLGYPIQISRGYLLFGTLAIEQADAATSPADAA